MFLAKQTTFWLNTEQVAGISALQQRFHPFRISQSDIIRLAITIGLQSIVSNPELLNNDDKTQ